jgi:hypothetical protein
MDQLDDEEGLPEKLVIKKPAISQGARAATQICTAWLL